MLSEFKDFIAKGNVMELAVAVIIAGAFAVIVASMTSDLIMPIVGFIFGGFLFLLLRFVTKKVRFVFTPSVSENSAASEDSEIPILRILCRVQYKFYTIYVARHP